MAGYSPNEIPITTENDTEISIHCKDIASPRSGFSRSEILEEHFCQSALNVAMPENLFSFQFSPDGRQQLGLW